MDTSVAAAAAVGAAVGPTVGVGFNMLSSSLFSSEAEISISSMEAHKSFSSDIQKNKNQLLTMWAQKYVQFLL